MSHLQSTIHLNIISFGFSYKGEDVNRTLEGGRKPLHYAADCGQLEILEFLLLKGADINVCKEHCHFRKKFLLYALGHYIILQVYRKQSEIIPNFL